ncbi:hypothetical protein BDM02DRAFT_3096981 [Thelephora ganbajun]|uniref:Uncharacterized protein n=1 Tax=Thelephora ganbajun TaxID=370292 RepID=A0ACB6ZEW4_THEGA|nr:hypothetical protein BDM02DRAFT_3096981 [Thelephora ganbajun]
MSRDGNGPDPDSTNDSHRLAKTHQDDDVRVECHPNSGPSTDLLRVNEHDQSVPGASATSEPEPWAPFQTREDFEFAEIVLEAGMTGEQIDAFIKLIHRCAEKGSEGSFTISNYKDMEDMLDVASNRLAKVHFKRESRKFDIWMWPISEWAEDTLWDGDLIHHLIWDVQHVSKFDGSCGSWIRVFNEPWAADHSRRTQVGPQ